MANNDKINFVIGLDLPKGWSPVLLYIACKDGRNGCTAARGTIAKFLKISVTTLDRRLLDLKAAGLISVKRRYHQTSIIRVVLPTSFR